jgi:hypothetical protein
MKRENTKKIKKYWKKNIYQWRRTYQNAQEIAKDWLKRIKIYKIGKFDTIFSTNEDPIGKKISILRRKIQN